MTEETALNGFALDSGPPSVEDISYAVSRDGHFLARSATIEEAESIVTRLGKILFVTDVTVRPGSKALVTSDRGLDFHTDHHRADLICWHCIEQTDEGGESVLLDGHRLLQRLRAGLVEDLRGLKLFEHKVFPGDEEAFPFLSQRFGRDKLYYSFWMLHGAIKPEQKAAFLEFKAITETEPCVRYRLQPGDILVIDNGRMLHGRTAIKGNKKRFLRRYWIETQKTQTK